LEGANSEDLRESWQVQVLNYLGNKFMVNEVVALSMLNKSMRSPKQRASVSHLITHSVDCITSNYSMYLMTALPQDKDSLERRRMRHFRKWKTATDVVSSCTAFGLTSHTPTSVIQAMLLQTSSFQEKLAVFRLPKQAEIGATVHTVLARVTAAAKAITQTKEAAREEAARASWLDSPIEFCQASVCEGHRGIVTHACKSPGCNRQVHHQCSLNYLCSLHQAEGSNCNKESEEQDFTGGNGGQQVQEERQQKEQHELEEQERVVQPEEQVREVQQEEQVREVQQEEQVRGVQQEEQVREVQQEEQGREVQQEEQQEQMEQERGGQQEQQAMPPRSAKVRHGMQFSMKLGHNISASVKGDNLRRAQSMLAQVPATINLSEFEVVAVAHHSPTLFLQRCGHPPLSYDGGVL
jgi:hypothetical protein